MDVISQTHKKLGDKIKIFRKKADLTQEDLAFQVGVDRSYMGFLERGERNPTLTTMIKVSQVFKIPVRELLP